MYIKQLIDLIKQDEQYVLFLFLILLYSCDRSQKNTITDKDSSAVVDSVYFNEIARLETMPLDKKAEHICLKLQDFTSHKSQQKPVYSLMKAMWHRMNGEKDSALFYLNKIEDSEKDIEIKILKFLEEQAINYKIQGAVDYDQSAQIFEYIKFAEKHDSRFTFRLYNQMAEVFYLNNKYQESLYYNNLWFNNSPNRDSLYVKNNYYFNRFVIAYHMQNVDTMKVYLDKIQVISEKFKNENNVASFHNLQAQYYCFKKDYKRALESSKKFFNYYKKINKLEYDNYHNLALAFLDNQQLDSALFYFKTAYRFAKENNQEIDGTMYYKNLAELYDKQGDYKNASIAKDSLRTHYLAFQEKVQNEKLEELKIQYQTEKKDSKIMDLDYQNRINKILLIAGLTLFVAVALFLYMTYNKKLLKAKNEKLESENKKLHLEQKVRQMQLNPHFIYNSIANLQGLIACNKNQEANAYLLSFSKLMRNVLELNRHDLIRLDEEIESLENYIRLQQMRFEYCFDYSIDTDGLDTEDISIPPMLLQPFVENAIEHGLKNISYRGLIHLDFKDAGGKLFINIVDNGSGKPQLGSKSKTSLSSVIIQERLDVLFNTVERQAGFESGPVLETANTGYYVHLYIPLIRH